jgi:L-alanine-DL-glutamate epimerase-like enolase superfamily enzyme
VNDARQAVFRMKIQSVEALAIEIPLRRNFGGSTYAVTKRCTVITRVRTDEGLESEVYNGDNRSHGPGIVRLIREALAPRLLGRDPLEVEPAWHAMFELTHASPERKTLIEAISCVDCALWDLAGKALGKSVAALLGAARRELPIISIGGYYGEGRTLADIGREMESYRAAGMAGCKFKVGGLAPEQDAQRIAAARRAAGPDFVLMADANRGWNVEQAIRFARLVEELNLAWFEEPCHWYDDAAMMAAVRRATRIPLTAGQSECTSHGVRRLVEAGAVDFVNYDASEGGGVTDWRRAALFCATAGVRMAHHEEPQIAAQLLAGVAHGTYLECFADPERDPVWQALWANRPPVRNGTIAVPQGPGFGIQLDAKAIERYRVA